MTKAHVAAAVFVLASAGTGTYLMFSSQAASGVVDSSTITNKFMLGYQGWFQCPTDGSPNAGWTHWKFLNKYMPDGFPDTSELTAAEKCDTGMKLPDGSPAYVFSSYNPKTVLRHFQWLKDYNIDGVMQQRFTVALHDAKSKATRDQVTRNVMAGANATGRTFNIMYDISGDNPATLVSTIQNDWKSLVDSVGVTKSDRYLRQGGRPVVTIWGFGFGDRPGTPADLNTLIDFFHNNPNPAYRATVMGGVNNDWRTNATWANALAGYDIISPWTVGRYKMASKTDTTTVPNWINSRAVPDINRTKQLGKLYMPVIYPGYSFNNSAGRPLNEIPRYGGNFLWQQAAANLSQQKAAGVPTMLYGAMFDEVDEGSAFMKQAVTTANAPKGIPIVTMNYDGYNLTNDWYLRVGSEINKMTNGSKAITTTLSASPQVSPTPAPASPAPKPAASGSGATTSKNASAVNASKSAASTSANSVQSTKNTNDAAQNPANPDSNGGVSASDAATLDAQIAAINPEDTKAENSGATKTAKTKRIIGGSLLGISLLTIAGGALYLKLRNNTNAVK